LTYTALGAHLGGCVAFIFSSIALSSTEQPRWLFRCTLRWLNLLPGIYKSNTLEGDKLVLSLGVYPSNWYI